MTHCNRPSSRLLLILACLWLTGFHAISQERFSQGRPAGAPFTDLDYLLVEDLNGDDLLDVVTLKAGDHGAFRVYLNEGDQQYSDPIQFGAGFYEVDTLQAVDLNQDGHLDIVLASNSRSQTEAIRTYLNDGTGRFTLFQRVGQAQETQLGFLVFGDFNGDGYPDAVFRDQRELRWRENDQTGRLVKSHFITNLWSYSGVVGDFNGDGANDLAVIQDGDLVWYVNDGQGDLTTSRMINSSFSESFELHSGDMEGDGDQDLLAFGRSGTETFARWFVNGGQGDFEEAQGVGVTTWNMKIADLDGDGDLDIVYYKPYYLEAEFKAAWLEQQPSGYVSHDLRYHGFNGNLRFVMADIDRDGHTDILAMDDWPNSQELIVFQNRDEKPLPLIRSFTIDENEVDIGGSATFRWVIEDAFDVRIDPVIGEIDLEENQNEVSLRFDELQETTFTLTATNPQGSVTSDVIVRVLPPLPIIRSFGVSDSTVDPGTEVEFYWNVDHATSVEVLPHPGSISIEESSMQVVVENETDFTLIATNDRGSVQRNLTVFAPDRSDFLSLSIDPESTGAMLATDGRRVIVGEPDRSKWIEGIGQLSYIGGAWIYEYDNERSEWIRVATLEVDEERERDRFGSLVEIFGDWAFAKKDLEVYVYLRNSVNGKWDLHQKLFHELGIYEIRIDHGTLMVGIPHHGNGMVQVYEVGDESWELTNLLSAAAPSGSGNFGSVISLEGNTAFVMDSGDSGDSSIDIFERNSLGAWDLVQQLSPPPFRGWGSEGRIVQSGDLAAVGSASESFGGFNRYVDFYRRDSETEQWLFEQTIVWWGAEHQIDMRIAMEGEQFVLGRFDQVNPTSLYQYDHRLRKWFKVRDIASSRDGVEILSARQMSMENHVLAIAGHDGSEYGVFILEDLIPTPAPVPVIVAQPKLDGHTVTGEDYSVQVDVSGVGPFSFEWFMNDDPLPHVIGDTLTIEEAEVADSGSYRVKVTTPSGVVESDPFVVKIRPSLVELVGQFEIDEFQSPEHAPYPTAVSGAVMAVGVPDFGSGRVFIYERNSPTGKWNERMVFEPDPDEDSQRGFGQTVALDRGTLVVGGGESAEVVWVYGRSIFGSWSLVQRLEPGIDVEMGFGASVAIEGNLIAVGAPAFASFEWTSRNGAVMLFKRLGDTTSNSWEYDRMFSGKSSGFGLGTNVAIDGSYVVAGASRYSPVTVYENINGEWSEEELIPSEAQDGDRFGEDLDISDGVIVVGAPADGNHLIGEGAVHVFEKNSIGIWTESDRLQASDRGQSTYFGTNVSIIKNTIISVARENRITGDVRTGAAYFYQRSRPTDEWQERYRLIDPEPVPYRAFGRSLSFDGDTFVITSKGTPTGIFVFDFNSNPLEAVFFSDPLTEAAVNVFYEYIIQVDAPEEAEVEIEGALLPEWLSLSETDTGLPVLLGRPDIRGEFEVRLTARVTPGGSEVDQIFTINVRESLNTPPRSTGFEAIAVDEDSGPSEMILNNIFDDDEDRFELEFSVVDNSNQALFGDISIHEGVLTLSYAPNAHGEALLRIRATDPGALFVEDLLHVQVRSVKDTPILDASEELVLSSSSGRIELFRYASDGDGDALNWSLIGFEPSHAFESLSLDSEFGYLFYQCPEDIEGGTASVTIRVTDPGGLYDESTYTVRLPGGPEPILGGLEVHYDPNRGIWDQHVTLSSDSDRPMDGVRIMVTNLPEGVRVLNAAGVTPRGYIIIQGEVVQRDQGRDLIIQYEAPEGTEGFNPALQATVMEAGDPLLDRGEPFHIDRIQRHEKEPHIEFTTRPWSLYEVQRLNGQSWQAISPRLRASGTRMFWRGPEREAPSFGLYRVVKFE